MAVFRECGKCGRWIFDTDGAERVFRHEPPVCDFVTDTGAYRCTLPQGHTEWHKVESNHSPRPEKAS